MNEPIANVGWTAADVQVMAPKMTNVAAQEWLEHNGGHIQDRIIELGWGVISTLLSYDGVETSEEEEGL